MNLIYWPVFTILRPLAEDRNMAHDDTQTGPARPLSAEDIAARRKAFEDGAHQMKMESLPLDPEHGDLHEAHIKGEMTTDELADEVYQRIKARRDAKNSA